MDVVRSDYGLPRARRRIARSAARLTTMSARGLKSTYANWSTFGWVKVAGSTSRPGQKKARIRARAGTYAVVPSAS